MADPPGGGGGHPEQEAEVEDAAGASNVSAGAPPQNLKLLSCFMDDPSIPSDVTVPAHSEPPPFISAW